MTTAETIIYTAATMSVVRIILGQARDSGIEVEVVMAALTYDDGRPLAKLRRAVMECEKALGGENEDEKAI